MVKILPNSGAILAVVGISLHKIPCYDIIGKIFKGVVMDFSSCAMRRRLFACQWLLAVILAASTAGQGAPLPEGGASSDAAVRLAAAEARLAGLRKEVDGLKAAHERKVGALKTSFSREETELRQTLEESRCEAEALKSRIQDLERDNLTMSNETVAVIGRLRAQLRAGRAPEPAPVRPGGAGTVVDRACSQCKGSGVVTRQESCGTCGGAGSFSKTSSLLRRTGTYSTSTVNERCANCKGRGQVTMRDTCSACDGSGRVPLDR